jgi:hypothetical protein
VLCCYNFNKLRTHDSERYVRKPCPIRCSVARFVHVGICDKIENVIMVT